MRAQFVAEVEQLRLKNQAISAGKKREAITMRETGMKDAQGKREVGSSRMDVRACLSSDVGVYM